MNSEDYARHDALRLAQLIARREVSREEVLQAAMARIAEWNPRINAVIDLFDEPVDDPRSQGPFGGVPFLLKDIGAGLAGKRTSCASRAFANAPTQAHDDELSRRFKAAGLRILGKTNLPEFGFNVTTEPELFGPTRNPYDLSRSAGGSSGGAAAAVAAGMVPLAHATDGAGSIRIPAVCCGLFGLKPSRGLIPQGPTHSDIYGGLVSEGIVTRSARDSREALDAMAGADAGALYAAPAFAEAKQPLRIGLLMDTASDIVLEPETHQALSLAAKRLAELGHHVAPVEPFIPPEDWFIPRRIYLAQVCAQAAADFAGKAIPPAIEAINRAAIERGRAMTAELYLTTMRAGHDFARRFAAIWQRFDVLLTPALAGVAPKLGQFPTDHEDVALHVDRMTRLAPFAGLFNLTGGAALVVPMGVNAHGLPLSVQLASDLGGDRLLLALGEAVAIPPAAPPRMG